MAEGELRAEVGDAEGPFEREAGGDDLHVDRLQGLVGQRGDVGGGEPPHGGDRRRTGRRAGARERHRGRR